jgi:mono/diheme cytochrome c family protein
MPRIATGRRLALACLPLVLAAIAAGGEGLPPAAERPVDFVKDVQPLLAAACYSCHGPDKQKGDLRLDRKASTMGSGAVVPGKSADSPMIQRVAGAEPATKMPPKGPALTPKQVGLLRAWIDQGARWPDVVESGKKGDDHWAYRPLAAPRVPAVKDPRWVRNPIDAFVYARLESQGWSPSPPADRRTLIRRVTFDLTGLPPTPEEIDTFLADNSLDAYEKVVDRLLASPHYGERWARHWMDVVHFAETHGNDQDVPRENAWPYRDYLIRAFNEDRPYGRFVAEQIAGDVLYPDDPQGVVATGFLAAGPWDESSQKDIRDDTIDKKIAQNLDRDDMVTTALSAFAGTTIHCARCHDHKFDPITQQEYYGLQAVFAGIDRANRSYDPDPQVARTRAALLRQKKELEDPSAARTSLLLAPAAQAEAAAWEKAVVGRQAGWTILHPASITAAMGSVPAKQPDGSVRFGGKRPEVDTYTVEAPADVRGITAVRLEVLTDDSLPHKGPGRQDNGNLHVSEFRVQAAPRSNPTARQAVALQNPSADFNQEGWTVAMAIDGNLRTAWGIYPEVGKPHAAVFEFKDPVSYEGGALLTFTLEQRHGGGHLIGRLRLSVTAAPRPVRLDPLPPAVSQALAVPPERRSDAQRAELARQILREKVGQQLAALPKQQMVYAAAADFQAQGSFKPARGCRPIQVLRRGDIRQPIAPAAPGALSCVPGLEWRFQLSSPEDEGTRRGALAHWLADPRNVLTWRSIVNRVWHYHFGRGIAASPNDLGRMGARPTHPELLDWLAVWFRDEAGGSLKRLHRLLVTSAAYRQSSAHRPDCAIKDGDNLLLWRMNRTRLDAESVRDAVLAASGKLDRTMGGPSVKHFVQSPGIHVTPKVDYLAYDVDSPGSQRRSVYRFLFRTLPDPFMDALDCPDASQFAPVRSTSVTALQALAMLNDRFVVRQSEHFAARVASAGDLRAQVGRAFLLALGRPPTEKESALLSSYAARHGMANACRLLFNSNEFMFVP